MPWKPRTLPIDLVSLVGVGNQLFQPEMCCFIRKFVPHCEMFQIFEIAGI